MSMTALEWSQDGLRGAHILPWEHTSSPGASTSDLNQAWTRGECCRFPQPGSLGPETRDGQGGKTKFGLRKKPFLIAPRVPPMSHPKCFANCLRESNACLWFLKNIVQFYDKKCRGRNKEGRWNLEIGIMWETLGKKEVARTCSCAKHRPEWMEGPIRC